MDSEIDRLRTENEELKAEHDKFCDAISRIAGPRDCWGIVEGDKRFDVLHELDLIVEVEPDEDFINEWGNETNCWQFRWLVEEKR